MEVRCVVFWGAGANAESVFSYPEPNIVGPDWGLAKRSRDGRFAALMYRDSRFLEVRTMTGEVVSSMEYDFSPNSPYDWLPDGSIVIEYDPDGFSRSGPVVLALTDSYTATLASTFSLPEGYEGIILSIVADPSGTRLALLYKPTVGNSLFQRPIVLDFNTNTVYEPVAPQSLEGAGMHWSPDGEWLIFQDANIQPFLPVLNAPGDTGRRAARTYAVRADGGTYPLPETVEASNDKARLILARPLDDPNGPLSPGNATPGGVWVD